MSDQAFVVQLQELKKEVEELVPLRGKVDSLVVALETEKQERKEEKASADLKIGALEKSNADMSSELKVVKAGDGKFSWKGLLPAVGSAAAVTTLISGLVMYAISGETKDIRTDSSNLKEQMATMRAELNAKDTAAAATLTDRGVWMQDVVGRLTAVESRSTTNEGTIGKVESSITDAGQDRFRGVDHDRFAKAQDTKWASQEETNRWVMELVIGAKEDIAAIKGGAE